MKKAGLSLFLFLLAACHPRPVEDLALADVAIRAAQKVKADALAPDAFRQAENFYLRAKRDFADGYYDSCKKYANEARLMAEKAEYGALFKQTQLKNKSEEETPSSSDSPSPAPTSTPTPPSEGTP